MERWRRSGRVGLSDDEDDPSPDASAEGKENDLILDDACTDVQRTNLSPQAVGLSSSASGATAAPSSVAAAAFFSRSLFLRRAFFFSTSASDRIRRTDSVRSEVRMKRSGWVGWNLMFVIGVGALEGKGRVERGVTSLASYVAKVERDQSVAL